MSKIGWAYIFLVALYSCSEEMSKQERPFKSKKEFEDVMILSHQEFLKKEKKKIEAFIDSLALPFQRTGTGLYYHVLRSTNGDSVRAGEIAVITYELKSINGELLYKSPEGKLQEFMVSYDNVETGLHEGIQKIRVGEEALFILPAHLGHGITGDQAAIPTQTTLVYRINFVGKK